MSNIKALHDQNKAVSAINLFKGEESNATAIYMKKGALFKEHITKIPAILICISGSIIFENEEGTKERINSGEYELIEPMIKHWLVANEDSQLILFK